MTFTIVITINSDYQFSYGRYSDISVGKVTLPEVKVTLPIGKVNDVSYKTLQNIAKIHTKHQQYSPSFVKTAVMITFIKKKFITFTMALHEKH